MYQVKEIFYTLQGEGMNAGRPAVFCRFAGCNLWSGHEKDRAGAVCKFCDTDFVGTDSTLGGRYASADALADAVEREWPAAENARRLAVLTGGEPALQVDAAFIDALHARGFLVAIETNGTLELPAGIDWVYVSPKAEAALKVRCIARGLRGARVRAFSAAADGRAGSEGEHRARRRVLHAAPEVAPEPPDA